MAYFELLPNEILENIFQYMNFKNRRKLSPVCTRWNNVLFSDQYLRKNVVFHIDGCRMLDAKMILTRTYPALSLKVDNQFSNEMLKNLRLINSFSPKPTFLRLENRNADHHLGWILDGVFFSLEDVTQLHLLGTCKTERGVCFVLLNNLKVLKIEAVHVEFFRVGAPNLTELQVLVRSEDHMDLLHQFADQLTKLTAVFDSKDGYYFYNLKFPQLTDLTVERSLKGMIKSEQDISIAFFRRLKQLTKLRLSFKFIDSYVMQEIYESVPNLVELQLEVCEGTIELSNISKLIHLKKLTIAAEKVNLLNTKPPNLKHLTLGSAITGAGTFVYAFENIMLLDNLRSLTLHNVKFYPEVLKLTPTYNVVTMSITHYKRLLENHLQIIVKRFPALQHLKIADCPGFTQREIDKIKRMNPRMFISFDEVRFQL
ncbi:uncharacterized protein LOC129723287 [Wyeomyia smithii]|uniref:uncharacterized protein LOC129723287 n=1 Tax=Wyeomyia smithii TaxID=174621 RepID=UPI002467B2B1|nr:uncharacterized protein LOC129723287 [Wyeomyia smithii]XP_055533389.1 uncharacterized protein LOC129723287 [Wyeomyia smithii]